MKNAPGWLRVFAIAAASACAVGSVTWVDRGGYAPATRLFEKDGLVVFWVGSNPLRASHVNGHDWADHVDVDFSVRNDRPEPVLFSTASARLMTQGESFPNTFVAKVELRPGEVRTFHLRFAVDFEKRPELLQRAANPRIVLGHAGATELAVDVGLQQN